MTGAGGTIVVGGGVMPGVWAAGGIWLGRIRKGELLKRGTVVIAMAGTGNR